MIYIDTNECKVLLIGVRKANLITNIKKN